MNKYERWYSDIVENAKTRLGPIESKETHHILPRSLGGTDDKDNLADLTPREHFVCHWLLTKIYTGEAKGKMINALYMMRAESNYQKRYHTKITSRVYAKLRNEYRQYISNLNKGRIQPPEEKAKQKAAMTGRTRAPFSEEWRAKLSLAKKGEKNNRYGAIVLEETKAKMRAKAIGRKQSAETIAKKAEAIRGSKREKIVCPHCRQSISVNTYPRWHGDRCRQKSAAK
jgi:hypothetical protein